MIKIRLSRQGKRNDPFYRVVALDSTKKRDGKSLAILGHWHPKTKLVKLDKKAIDAFAKNGAQISPAVKNLLNS